MKGINENIREQIPMDLIGHGEEIAKAALFLATTDSSYAIGIEFYG